MHFGMRKAGAGVRACPCSNRAPWGSVRASQAPEQTWPALEMLQSIAECKMFQCSLKQFAIREHWIQLQFAKSRPIRRFFIFYFYKQKERIVLDHKTSITSIFNFKLTLYFESERIKTIKHLNFWNKYLKIKYLDLFKIIYSTRISFA